MRWSLFGVGALVGILALMGCASAEEKDYLREVNAICAEAKKHLGEIPSPSSPAEVPKIIERQLTIREEVIAKFGELAPPINIAGGADNVFKDLEARQERARALKEAVEHKEEKEVRKLEEEARTEAPIEAGRARAAKLDDCAEL